MIAKNIFIKGDILMERQDGFIRDGKEKTTKKQKEFLQEFKQN